METGEALALHASLSAPKGDVELLPRGRPEHPRSPATMEEEPAVQLPGQPEPAATEEDKPEAAPPLHPRVSGGDVVGGSSAEEIPAPDDSHAKKEEEKGEYTAGPRVEGGGGGRKRRKNRLPQTQSRCGRQSHQTENGVIAVTLQV